MAIEKTIDIVVNQVGVDKAINDTGKLSGNLNKLDKQTESHTNELNKNRAAVLENGGALGILNELTGGQASLVKDALEATDLFSKGTAINTGLQKLSALAVGTTTGALKALRVALISTGVGALVVGLGLLIAYLADSADNTEELAKQQELLGQAIKKSTALLKTQTEEIDYSTKLRTLSAQEAGKSEQDLRAIERQGHEDRLAALKEEQDRLLSLQATRNLSLEKSKEINDLLLANTKAFIAENNAQEIRDREFARDIAVKKREDAAAAAEKQAEDAKKRREEERQRALEYQKQLAEDLKNFNAILLQVQNDEITREIEAQQEKNDLLNSLQADNFEYQLELEKKRGLEILDAANASATEYDDFLQNIEKRRTDFQEEQSKERLRIAQAEADQKNAIQNAQLDVADSAIGLAKQLGEKNKGIQKAAVIAENAAGIARIVINTAAANAKAVAASPLTGGQPFVGINFASAAIGIAASVGATVKALKELGGGSAGGASSSSGGGSAPAAPSFNIVGQSGTNQLAESIQNRQGDQPLRAYVVGQDVTSQQALDRNITNTATFG